MAPPLNYLHWIEISRSALSSNIKYFRKLTGHKTKIMVMVKADAYGHGLNEVAPVISPLVDFFGVNTFEEALKIKKLKLKTPIFIAAPIPLSQVIEASMHRFSLCVPSLEYLHFLQSINRSVVIHLKINTGMNRLGISMIKLLTALEIIRHSPRLKFEGIYTHFHSADTNPTATLIQFDQFQQAVFQSKYYFPYLIAHCANTAATLNFPQTHLDMIRPGLGIYGLWPKLKPVLSWKCHPVQIRQVSADETVGYSGTYTCTKPGEMAVLPIGYSDGYSRKLSNTGRVWSGGQYFPVIGNVAMNFTAIDISNLNLQGYANRSANGTARQRPRESEHLQSHIPKLTFELLGPHVTAGEIATKIGTINYEVVSGLNPVIPRIIVK